MSQKRQILRLGLSDQHSVKGVMVSRSTSGAGKGFQCIYMLVPHLDRQKPRLLTVLRTFLSCKRNVFRVNRVLDGDFPDGNRTVIDGVVRVKDQLPGFGRQFRVLIQSPNQNMCPAAGS